MDWVCSTHPCSFIPYYRQGLYPPPQLVSVHKTSCRVFVVTQITQWDLDELQEIAAGFSKLHGKKTRTRIETSWPRWTLWNKGTGPHHPLPPVCFLSSCSWLFTAEHRHQNGFQEQRTLCQNWVRQIYHPKEMIFAWESISEKRIFPRLPQLPNSFGSVFSNPVLVWLEQYKVFMWVKTVHCT